MGKQKVAVIRCGVAGSGVAALLAHSGRFEVDLYEKNGIVGDRFVSYVKEGFRLDVGCHMIANCGNGTLGEILKILGQPEAVGCAGPRPFAVSLWRTGSPGGWS